MKRMSDGSRAAGGASSERGRAGERERNNISAAVALAAGIACVWPAPAGAQTAPQTLTVTPAGQRLERVSQEVRDAVRIIDSGDGAARADRLWRMYRAVSRRGNAALVRWAFELQSVVRGRKGNYLHALCWVLNEYDSGRARTFATELARRGVAIGPNTGHYEVLAHLDPSGPIPDQPPHADSRSLDYYVDAVAAVEYDLSYRPERKGQLSKLLQVTYDDGTRLDIDIRLIADNYDPANLHSLGYRYVGLGGRLYPLRMDRLSTPRLWAAKHAALAEMRRYNEGFVELVSISTSGTMLPLGLAVPVQQPAAGAARTGRATRTTAAPRSARSRTASESVAAGRFPRDFATKRTRNLSARYKSERHARNVARTKLGRHPARVEPGKLRSRDGRWQYRGKPEDLAGHGPKDSPHIHLERLDPKTGEILENWHLRWD